MDGKFSAVRVPSSKNVCPFFKICYAFRSSFSVFLQSGRWYNLLLMGKNGANSEACPLSPLERTSAMGLTLLSSHLNSHQYFQLNIWMAEALLLVYVIKSGNWDAWQQLQAFRCTFLIPRSKLYLKLKWPLSLRETEIPHTLWGVNIASFRKLQFDFLLLITPVNAMPNPCRNENLVMITSVWYLTSLAVKGW